MDGCTKGSRVHISHLFVYCEGTLINVLRAHLWWQGLCVYEQRMGIVCMYVCVCVCVCVCMCVCIYVCVCMCVCM